MQSRRVLAGVCLAALVGGVRVAHKLWPRQVSNDAALLADDGRASSTSVSGDGETVAPSTQTQASSDAYVHPTEEADTERPATAVDEEAAVSAVESSMSNGEPVLASGASSESAGGSDCQEESSMEVPDDWEEWCVDNTEASLLTDRFTSSHAGTSTSAAVSVHESRASPPEPQCKSPEALTDEEWLTRHGCDAAVPTGRFLGEGATARCHEATVTLPSGRTVWAAKKVLFCSEDPVTRILVAKVLQREVAGMRAAASSGRAVALYGFVCDEEAGRFEILMQLGSGGTLQEELEAAREDTYVKREQPVLSVRRTKKIARCMLECLAAMHESGFAHMDIKPENILLSADGEPLLADFGMTARVNKEGFVEHDGGTPFFWAPEVDGCGGEAAKQITVKADMYSAGLVLSSCIAWGNGLELYNVEHGNVVLPGFVPADLRDLITQLTAWKPQDRPTPAEALLHPFFTALKGPGKGPSGPRPRELVQTW